MFLSFVLDINYLVLLKYVMDILLFWTLSKLLSVLIFVLLWGVTLLEHNIHPDHNKGPEKHTMSYDASPS